MRRKGLLAPALLLLPFALTLTGPVDAAAPSDVAAAGAYRAVAATPPQTGEAAAAPALVSIEPGRVDVFEQSPFDTVHQTVRAATGAFSKVFDQGGVARSAPAAATPGNRHLSVFAKTTGDAVAMRTWTGRWSAWTNLGGRVNAAPAAVSTSPGRVDVFVRGTNNMLYTGSVVSGRWSGWRGLGGALTSAPAAAGDGAGAVRVFVRGGGDVIYERTSTNGVWSRSWTKHPGAVASSPAAAGQHDGRMALFARDASGALLVDNLTAGSWSGWQPLDGALASAPAAVSSRPGVVEVLARHTDGLMRIGTWDGVGWSGWSSTPMGLNAPVSRELAPGVQFQSYFDEGGPWAVQQVLYDLSSPARLDTQLASDELAGFEPTSSIAARRDALVAVNGDFGLPSGRPVHVFAQDGHLTQTQQEDGYNFAYDARQLGARMGVTPVERTFLQRRTGVKGQVDLINPETAPAFDQLAEYSPTGRGVSTPPQDACSAQVRPVDAPQLRTDGRVQQEMVVDQVLCGISPPVTDDASVISAPTGGTKESFVRNLQTGDQIAATWALSWRQVYDSLGGNPVLVQNSAIATTNVDQPGAYFGRQPRTGVGYTDDGRVFIVTVDGRQPGYSAGMTMREFAALFVRLGATWALNLDGGGSTTMVVEGEVTNRTCCNVTTGVMEERPISSALLVLRGADPDEVPPPPLATATPTPTPTPTDTPSPPPALTPGAIGVVTSSDAVLDPGSTGGLADALARRGERLSPELREVVRSYRRLG